MWKNEILSNHFSDTADIELQALNPWASQNGMELHINFISAKNYFWYKRSIPKRALNI